MDTRKKVDFIKNWIQNYVNTMPAKANSLVIGISGGIDSSVSSTLCALTGMKTIVLDQGDLGQGASGVNAGTLSLQIKRVKLMPYALKGHSEWEAMGEAVGFKKTGGYTLAFTDHEAELLYERH